jgi:hypothetical protein
MALNHSNLLNLTLLEISHARVAKAWRNETGTARSFDNERVIKFGFKGSSDIIGITRSGKFLAVEIKTGKDDLRPEQKVFKKVIEENGGRYFLIRSENDIEGMVLSLKNTK